MSGRTVICDIQGFRGLRNEFIVKEAAFISCSGSKVQSLVFKPPYPITTLPETQQKVATWLKSYFHGMDWNDGYTPYYELKNVFTKILGAYNIVYVKGSEKRLFIESLLSKYDVTVLDLDLMCCPKLNDLKKLISYRKCFYHPRLTDQCASENVRLIFNWYTNYYLKKPKTLGTEEKTIKKLGEIIEKLNKPDKFGNTSLSKLEISEISYLPKEFLLYHVSLSDIQYVWDLLPSQTRENLKDILYCYEHHNSSNENSDQVGPPPRKINCEKCRQLK